MAHALRPALDPAPDPGDEHHDDPSSAVRRPRWPTLDHVWAALPVVIPIVVSLATRMVAIDLAYHVRAGEQVLRGTIPRADTWTFTVAGTHWLDQQWGAQALLALVHHLGGFAAISVLRAGLIGLTFALVYLACRAKGASPRTSSLLSLGGFVVCLQTLAMRPQLFAVVLFAAALWIVAGRHDHPARLWALPVLTIVWANVHGSFVFAPLLVGLALVEDVIGRDPGRKRLALIVGRTTIATLVNPFGVGVWVYVKDLSTNPMIRDTITEWAPMSVSTFSGIAFFATAAVIAGWLARKARPIPWGALLWLGTFFALALPARRGVIWWALVAPVAIAGLMHLSEDRVPPSEDRDPHGSRALNIGVLAALLGLVLVMLPWWRPHAEGSLLSEAPVGLAGTTAALPAGSRVVVPQPWGSWFEYASPDTPVFVDPRIELYPADVWNDYLTVRSAGAGWREILGRYGVEGVVADRRTWGPLIAELQDDPGWHLAYEDRDGMVFVRINTTSQTTP
ncbi:MAG TPA: hypothetical protein VNG34_06275 [Actinomycetota bacterium]|nr:hypothetical protein [Actinomycetota bacterium]